MRNNTASTTTVNNMKAALIPKGKIIYSKIYTPDRAFMNKLKQLDKRLDCIYRLDIERFVITWHMPAGPPSELFVVRAEDGGFRHPDMRELHMLSEGDLHRTGIRSRLEKTEKYMREYREQQEKFEADEIRNQTRDDKIQLSQAYRTAFNIGTKRSAHRRIIPKTKGKSFNELDACVAQ